MDVVIDEKIERVFDMFETSFIQGPELILHKRWNIYFRLDNIYSSDFFDYKILSYLSYYIASNHYKRLSKECIWASNRINRWFRHVFTYDDMQTIYTKLGCGANETIGIKFIKSGFNMNILEEEGK